MGRALTVIRRAIASGRHRLPFLFGLAAVIFVPLGFFNALETTSVGHLDGDDLGGLEIAQVVGATSVYLAAALLGQLLYSGAVAVAVISTPLGVNPSLRRIARETRWRDLIVVDLLFSFGMLVSVLLFVVPAIFFLARYALCAVLAEVEGLGVRASFHRSAELSRGSRKLVFGLMIGTLFLTIAVSELITAAAAALGADTFIAAWMSSAVGQVLVNPIAALIVVALVLYLGGGPGREDSPSGAPSVI